MTSKLLGTIGIALLLGMLSSVTCADEISELKRQVLEQNAKLKALEERLEKYEARQQDDDQVLAQQASRLSPLMVPTAKSPDDLNWYDRIKLSGDFRYRYETIEAEGDGKPDRHRNRFRARIALKAKVDDQWDLGFRFASGSEDPVSANQTMTGSFSSKGFWVDRAYLNYHPEAIRGLNVWAGKIGNPFYKAGKNQLLWDDSLSLEGVAARHKISLGETAEVFVTGGGFIVTESSSSDADMSIWGMQGGLKNQFDTENSVLVGMSYYNYGNIKGAADLDVKNSSFFGNSSNNGVFINDYDLVELFAEFTTKSMLLPLSLFGNHVTNIAADTEGDTGWLVGCRVNKTDAPGSWEFGYNYRELQKDAVVGTFSEASFIGGGTNGRGSCFGVKYQVAKNVQAALDYFLDKRQDADNKYRRLQANMALKF
ncbi:MAG: putative porin [Phycisphaerae bacterium]|nr:putative porin [Phycisphaerae bacterium]